MELEGDYKTQNIIFDSPIKMKHRHFAAVFMLLVTYLLYDASRV